MEIDISFVRMHIFELRYGNIEIIRALVAIRSKDWRSPESSSPINATLILVKRRINGHMT